MDTATLAAVTLWLEQYAAHSEALKVRSEQAAAAAWASFDAWYNAAEVAAVAAQVAGLSRTAQTTTTGLAAQYVAEVVGALTGQPIRVPRPSQATTPEVRNGVDLQLVHMRPAEVFKRAVSTGTEEPEARDLAIARAGKLVRTDLTLVERTAETAQMETAGVKRYRRVLRPELSKSGSCGLCIAAADRLYRTSDLMPIHPPYCRCKTMPVVAGQDPAEGLNAADIKRLYAEAHDVAGSTSKKDLANVRVKVNEHGELGPVLSRAGDSFRGPKKVALEDDPERAARMLEQTLPTLAKFEKRAAAGDDVAEPLAYQRQLVAKLRGITAHAA